MANAFLLKPLTATATVGAGTVQAGTAPYVLNDYVGVVLQLACDNAGNTAVVVFDLGGDQSIDTLMLFGVELFPTGGTVFLDYATAAQGAFTGAYSTVTFAPYAGATAMTNGKGVSLWFGAAAVTTRYLRLTFAGTTSGQAVRLSRLAVGKRVQLSRNFSFGAGLGVKELGSLDFSRRGVLLRTRGAKLRTVSLTFPSIRKDEAEATVRPLFEALGNTEMFALCTDPTADTMRQNRCSYGPLVGDVSLKLRNAAAWEAAVNQVSIF